MLVLGTSLAADRIQLIDKDDRGLLLASGGEKFSDSLGTSSNEDLVELGAMSGQS